MKKVLNIIQRSFGIFFEVFVSLVVLYLFIYVILSRISIVPSEHSAQTDASRMTIYVSSNGVHTDFVLPIRSEWKDWSKSLELEEEILVDTFQSHFAIGWGDKNFFLKTKEWSDLTVGTAASAMFGLGEGAVHVVLCAPRDLKPENYFELSVTKKEYELLCKYIDESLTYKNKHVQQIVKHPYGNYHFFFDSRKSYSILFTCNSWTNAGLKAAHKKACLWTPFKDGIFVLYK